MSRHFCPWKIDPGMMTALLLHDENNLTKLAYGGLNQLSPINPSRPYVDGLRRNR